MTDHNDQTDEQIFEHYRSSGDPAALEQLVVRYENDLFRFLYRLLGDRAAAEDIFQETFLQVHLAQHTFDTSRKFRPWLFTIGANKARDLLRKKGRRRTVPLSASVGDSDGRGTTFVDLMEIDIPAPDAALDSRETEARVQTALSELSPVLREILLLAYFQRLSYAQIAEDLQIPLGTVKSRLHAAVASFAKAWKRLSRQSGGPDADERTSGGAS